jgi:hypothetical protein
MIVVVACRGCSPTPIPAAVHLCRIRDQDRLPRPILSVPET